MNRWHERTLQAIFANPVNGNIEWRRIEALFLALGAVRTERAGAAVSFALNGVVAQFHRPPSEQGGVALPGQGCPWLSGTGRNQTMNKMKYRGYTARIEFDEVDRIFVGHLAGIRDIVGFHGTTVDELESAFRESVDHYIAVGEEQGRPAQKPYSGRLMLRVPPEIHAAVAMAAGIRGKSINQWASEVLGKAASQS